MNFINEHAIFSLLANPHLKEERRQLETIGKSAKGERLTIEDVASLLQVQSSELREEIHKQARELKHAIYGNRLVFFAPLYLTNSCINNCLYCSFRRDNKSLLRATLSQDEIRCEVEILIDQGHKRLLLVAGEDPRHATLDYISESVKTVYGVKRNSHNIRRVNINAAPFDIDNFRILKSFGIGTYQCFQETYHQETYAYVHPAGKKRDYNWRIQVMDRAMEAGIDDVGIGVLFGLYDYKFEVLALMQHIFHLEDAYNGVGPHTISVPRLEPALNAPLDASNSPWAVSDDDFKDIVAILRLAVPYTGMILSTRERPEIRRTLFDYGISQISAGSRTDPGGYLREEHETAEQFQLGDHRSIEEIVRDVVSLGYMPSFCTACYRSGRTGDRFMELAKSGNIGKICSPNAIITLVEYLNEYADEKTRESSRVIIEEELEKMPPGIRKKTFDMIERVNRGESDIYL